jgi:hypothetical protein
VVRDADDAQPETAGLQNGWASRLLEVRSGAHRADARRMEQVEGVDERGVAEVEGVVVGERDAVESEE